MDTDHKLYDAPLNEWPEQARKKPQKPENLPPSSDKDFWPEETESFKINKDEIELRKQQTIEQMSSHSLVHKGYEIVCTSCPFPHSVPVDPNKFKVVDGKLSPIDIEVKK